MYERYVSISPSAAIAALKNERKKHHDRLAIDEAIEMLMDFAVPESLQGMHDEWVESRAVARRLDSRGLHKAAEDERAYAATMLEAMRVVMRLAQD